MIKTHPAFNLSPERNTVTIRRQTDCALALLKSNMKQCGFMLRKEVCSKCPFNKSIISGGYISKRIVNDMQRKSNLPLCPIKVLATINLNKATTLVIDWLDCIYGRKLTKEIIVEVLI